jgi:hypothetical protein
MLASPRALPADDSTLVTVSSGTVLMAMIGLASLLLAFIVIRTIRLGLPGSSLRDRVRSYLYLERFGITLGLRGFGDRGRRAAVAELRSNLEEASRSSGMVAAIAALGPARRLAASVSEGRVRPTWSVGLIAAVIGVGASLALHMFALGIWIGAAEAAGADVANGTTDFLPWATFSYERDGDFIVESPWLLIIPVVAFLLWSRPWRLRRVRAN